jgi:phage FluMu gp28-like protein
MGHRLSRGSPEVSQRLKTGRLDQLTRCVEGVSFTTSTKEELAYPVRVAFEERTIKVPFTNAIRADLRGVRKEVTSSGHTRFAGERNRYGHCDRFWALALALHAAKTPTTGAIDEKSISQIRFGLNSRSTFRRFTPRTLQQTAGLGLLRDVK